MSAEELNETEIRTEGQDTYVSVKGKLDTMRAMTLDEQLESLAEDYVGFDWISVSHGVVRFFYLRKKEGVA